MRRETNVANFYFSRHYFFLGVSRSSSCVFGVGTVLSISRLVPYELFLGTTHHSLGTVRTSSYRDRTSGYHDHLLFSSLCTWIAHWKSWTYLPGILHMEGVE